MLLLPPKNQHETNDYDWDFNNIQQGSTCMEAVFSAVPYGIDLINGFYLECDPAEN